LRANLIKVFLQLAAFFEFIQNLHGKSLLINSSTILYFPAFTKSSGSIVEERYTLLFLDTEQQISEGMLSKSPIRPLLAYSNPKKSV
jgi:hypothetical protein